MWYAPVLDKFYPRVVSTPIVKGWPAYWLAVA